MIALSQDSPLAEFKYAIQNTRAKYSGKICRLWEQVQRLPDNKLLRFELARQIEPYVQDAEEDPPIVLNQPDLDSDVWQGAHNLGTVVDTGIPCRFDPDLFTYGGVTIIAGAARSGKSTFIMNLLRGFIADGRACVTVFDPNGSCTGLVREFPGQLDAFNLKEIPLGLFAEPDLDDTTIADLSEIYNIKLSRSELNHAIKDLRIIYKEGTGGAANPALGDLKDYLADNYWRNPFDKSQGLRRTLVTTLQGIWDRCPSLRVSRGANPARDLFSRNTILTTEDFQDIQDLRFAITFLIRSLWRYLRETVTQFDLLRNVIVLEDSTSLLTRDADRCTTTGISPLVDIGTKIGKYGVNLLVLSQSIDMLSDALLSNAAHFIVCGSLSNDADLLRAHRILGLETRQ